jgi:hypothetical protein
MHVIAAPERGANARGRFIMVRIERTTDENPLRINAPK